MFIDGAKVRYDDVFVGETPEMAGPLIDAYNGVEYRRLMFADGQRQKEPQGLIAREITRGFTTTATASPILLIFRGTKGSLNASALTEFRDGDLEFDSQGNAVLRVRQGLADGTEEEKTLKLRPGDFAPLQLMRSLGGVASLDIRIDYDASSEGIPMPIGWTVLLQQFDGRLLMSSKATVTFCKVNEALDATLFDLPFPAGTIVEDYRNTASITDTPRWTLITENGEREIEPHELRKGVTREMLAQTRTGDVFGFKPKRRVSLILIINIVVVLALLVMIVARLVSTKRA
jgi:hypothetical protein